MSCTYTKRVILNLQHSENLTWYISLFLNFTPTLHMYLTFELTAYCSYLLYIKGMPNTVPAISSCPLLNCRCAISPREPVTWWEQELPVVKWRLYCMCPHPWVTPVHLPQCVATPFAHTHNEVRVEIVLSKHLLRKHDRIVWKLNFQMCVLG